MSDEFNDRAVLIVKELKRCGVDEYAAPNFVSSKRCEIINKEVIIWWEKNIRIDVAALTERG